MAQKKITDLDLRSSFDSTCNFPVDDTTQTYRATAGQVNDYLKPNYQKSPNLLKNVGLSVTASAGAMTVALKQSDGSTALSSSAPAETEIAFRSVTLTSGARSVVAFSAATSVVIPSTATLGYSNGQNARVFVYAYSDGTNQGLAVSASRKKENILYSLTAISTGSTSLTGFYSTTARTNAAIRLIGEFQVSAITTAGTWTTPTYVDQFSPTVTLANDASEMTDAEATRQGVKEYNHGTTYNGGVAPTVTSSVAGLSIDKASFMPFQDQAGTWYTSIEIQASYSANSHSTANLTVNGLGFANEGNNGWALACVQGNNLTNICVSAIAARNTAIISYQFVSAQTSLSLLITGWAKLSAKPTWAY